MATYTPGRTANPHDPSRTPGGSSSGSAAAVAAGMVPVAIGTQTNGSVIRPAAFCGAYGFKPSMGWIPRTGILKLSPTLDSVGLFARSLEDLALVCEQLVGWDEEDAATRARARPPMLATLAQEPPLPPRLGLVQTPNWAAADPATLEAFRELGELLGEHGEAHVLGDSWAGAWDWHRTIMEAEMAFHLQAEWERGRQQMSAPLQAQLERGRATTALAYQQAVRRIPALNDSLDALFERCDALLVPATPGTAPPIAGTGDPAFCTIWSLCGMPALSLPLMQGPDGLPLGVQLVGRRGDDARLLRTARWLVAQVERGAA